MVMGDCVSARSRMRESSVKSGKRGRHFSPQAKL